MVFFAELIATSMIAVQEWTGIHYLKGNLYLGYSLLSDGFGLLGIVGILMALWRRLVVKPERMNSVLDDYLALWLLLLVFVQGFVVEGLRIAATELRQNPALAPWSPGGYTVALTLQGLSVETLQFLHRINWWFHAVTAFVLLGYMGFGKFNHIWYGLLNIFCRNLGPSGKLSFIDIEATMEADPRGHRNPGGRENRGVHLEESTGPGRMHELRPLPGRLPRLYKRRAAQPPKADSGHEGAFERGGLGGARGKRRSGREAAPVRRAPGTGPQFSRKNSGAAAPAGPASRSALSSSSTSPKWWTCAATW